MRKITLITLLLLTSCKNSIPEKGTEPFKERSIYLKDSQGRCLRISTHVEVSGFEHFQDGYLQVKIITNKLCIGE